MKCTDTEKSFFTPLTLGCVTAVIAALVPSSSAQVANIEQAPESTFDTEREDALAKFMSAGPISVRPHLSMTAYYDDNLALQPHAEREDFVWRISPGVLFGAGEFRGDKGTYFSLDYTPTGSIYTKYSDYNALDHYVIFNAGWKLAKLTLGVSQAYEIASGKQIEASAFVEQETYTTLLTSKYDLSEKTSFELNGRQSLVSTENQVIGGPNEDFISINEWVVEGWGDYKTSEKLTVGAGITVGWRDIVDFSEPDAVNVVDSPNQTFQQFLVRSIYHATGKLDLRGSLGVQISQFQDGDDDGPNLVFSLGSSWQALERTSVAVDAYRQDRPSYTFSGRNYTATGFRASVRQMFLEKYSATLALGYENTDYTNISGPTGDSDRNDDYFWIRPTLDYQFDEHWAMGVFYQFRAKSSNQPADAFDYSNNQVGLYSNYRF
jgi:hypothetical protein